VTTGTVTTGSPTLDAAMDDARQAQQAYKAAHGRSWQAPALTQLEAAMDRLIAAVRDGGQGDTQDSKQDDRQPATGQSRGA